MVADYWGCTVLHVAFPSQPLSSSTHSQVASFLIPLFSFSHSTARRCVNVTQANQANEQLIVQFSKPRPLTPKLQAPPPPTTAAPVAADTSARPTPAPRAQTASLKKPAPKKPGVKAPKCPPPLPPPLQGKAVPSVAQ